MTPAAPRYWAFVSYSHRDSRVASRLQRAIETYRFPKALVGTRTIAGVVPESLKPVFRDRDELQASIDLKGVVHEALAQSRYLIVICSPDAARSAWVNAEIIEFKKLHGESRVLAVIARGEPFASRTPGREAEECFPPALRATLRADGTFEPESVEPIAPDLRPTGDGERRAILKLIAGMTGLGANDLIRRHAKRRMRQLTMLTIGSVAGMAVMAGLAQQAVWSRNEAQAQRREAEVLLEFMLGDLRKKLTPVGRLDVLDGVGEKALEYYERQEASRLDGDALGRRSRALHLIGELRQQRRQLEPAEVAFRRAAETTAQLLAREPKVGQRVFDHAQSVYWVGHVAWLRGEYAAAEKEFKRYIELADRLVELDATKPDWRAETAYARVNVGVVCLDTGRFDEALGYFAPARATWQTVIRQQPARAIDLANCVGWIARAHELRGDFPAAIETQQEKLRVLEAVPDASSNQLVKRQQRVIYLELARLELSLGHAAEAHRWATTGHEAAKALVAVDKENKIWTEQLHLAEMLLAEAKLAIGDRGAARTLAAAAHRGTQGLLDESKLAARQVDLRARSLWLATQLADESSSDQLKRELRDYLQKAERIADGDLTKSNVFDLNYARARDSLATLLTRTGESGAAAAEWRAAAARLERHEQSNDWHLLTLLARIRFQLGETEKARALAKRIEVSPYRHPGFADLMKLIAGGPGRSVMARD